MPTDSAPHFAAADNPFRLLLFADQSLDQLLALRASLPAQPPQPWSMLEEADRLAREGRPEQARQRLYEVLDFSLETRVSLWTWVGLRALGAAPADEERDRVRGVVLEVPMHSGVDTVAVYADNSACYINYTGLSPIIWDAQASPASEYTSDIIAIVQPLLSLMIPVADHLLPPHTQVWVSALTFGGCRRAAVSYADFIEGTSPFSPLYATGGELVSFLVSRVWHDQDRADSRDQ